ncbi:MAG TPA: hypothetical protein VK153_03690 [Candidatus Paceibacterota bacterium]|nr:hypothetical protein [Candidatus Paceibacterota bacterium]
MKNTVIDNHTVGSFFGLENEKESPIHFSKHTRSLVIEPSSREDISFPFRDLEKIMSYRLPTSMSDVLIQERTGNYKFLSVETFLFLIYAFLYEKPEFGWEAFGFSFENGEQYLIHHLLKSGEKVTSFIIFDEEKWRIDTEYFNTSSPWNKGIMYLYFK